MAGDRVSRRVKPPSCTRCTRGYIRCDDPECGLCADDADPQCPRATACPDCGWYLEGALTFVRELAVVLQKCGWGVGLTGSVLFRGVSAKDLDLIVYPLNSTEVSGKMRVMALESMGLIRQCEIYQTHATWRRHGSLDCKLVELWRAGPRRIDLFILS